MARRTPGLSKSLAAVLPEGIGMPRLLRIDEQSSSINLWMEDAGDTVGWGADRYRRTARMLGRLAGLGTAMPNLIDRLDEVPRGVSHGDAAPSNFLESGDGVVTAVDWSYASVAPIGSDLSQLVAGRVEVEPRTAGQTIVFVHEVVNSFAAGLAEVGRVVDPATVKQACVTYLAARFVFSALIADAPGHPEQSTAHQVVMERRATLGRVGMDLAIAQI